MGYEVKKIFSSECYINLHISFKLQYNYVSVRYQNVNLKSVNHFHLYYIQSIIFYLVHTINGYKVHMHVTLSAMNRNWWLTVVP